MEKPEDERFIFFKLTMTPEIKKMLDELKERAGLQTHSELIRQALCALDMLVSFELEGKKLALLNPDGTVLDEVSIFKAIKFSLTPP